MSDPHPLHNLFSKTGTTTREGLLRLALGLDSGTLQPSVPVQFAQPDLSGLGEVEGTEIEGEAGAMTAMSDQAWGIINQNGEILLYTREDGHWITEVELANRFAAPRYRVHQVIELLGLSESRIHTKVGEDGEIMYTPWLHESARNLHRKTGRTPPKPVCATFSELDADKP